MCIGTPTTTVIYRYRVLGIQTKLYNTYSLTGDKYKWSANKK